MEKLKTNNKNQNYYIDVCTSCRDRGMPREPLSQRPGYKLFNALKDKLATSNLNGMVEVRPAECLSICKRPCGISISSLGSWAYLFGDQQPQASIEEIIEVLHLYIKNQCGIMRREDRPEGLQASILGKIPPNGAANVSS